MIRHKESLNQNEFLLNYYRCSFVENGHMFPVDHFASENGSTSSTTNSISSNKSSNQKMQTFSVDVDPPIYTNFSSNFELAKPYKLRNYSNSSNELNKFKTLSSCRIASAKITRVDSFRKLSHHRLQSVYKTRPPPHQQGHVFKADAFIPSSNLQVPKHLDSIWSKQNCLRHKCHASQCCCGFSTKENSVNLSGTKLTNYNGNLMPIEQINSTKPYFERKLPPKVSLDCGESDSSTTTSTDYSCTISFDDSDSSSDDLSNCESYFHYSNGTYIKLGNCVV